MLNSRRNDTIHALASEVFGSTDLDEESEVERSIAPDVEMIDAWSVESSSAGTQRSRSGYSDEEIFVVNSTYCPRGQGVGWAFCAGAIAAVTLMTILLSIVVLTGHFD